MRFLFKSHPDVLTIAVLGAVVSSRDALATALTLHVAHAATTHTFTIQAGADLTLLVGLSHFDALPGSAAHLADQSLRRELNDAAQPYHVLYGAPHAQLVQAVRLINRNSANRVPAAQVTLPQQTAWRWACDTCSDPACERKLLTDLLAQRHP